VRTQLLCTFAFEESLEDTLDDIIDTHDILFNRIFVLESDDEDELMCTYNISYVTKYNMLPDTISVHRKKETNTIYTINALNQLIRMLNGGNLDKSYTVNWDDYSNSIMLVRGGEFSILPTKVYNIITIE
jgi:hypothetical protein